MRTKIPVAGAVLLISAAAVAADGDAKRGASVYRACVACHSLEPNVHLTGPSLAGLWGKKAASIADYPRYSEALKTQEFFWDETTLNAWVADPAAFVKDNSMTFRGIKDDKTRADLIAFLRLAFAPDGAKSVVAKGLLPARMARGQVPESLDRARPEEQVVSVRHCRNSFFVVTANGTERSIWEMNLRLKVDSGPNGPKGGKPVLTQSGMQGDRASLVFSGPAQISTFVQSKC
ncbi:MAG: c-type cytochrome [Rhizobiales bacterium]|nr:c-type cytochrome [Hyphomicrobiales bacterium]